MTLRELLQTGPVVPVIVIDRVEDAVPLAAALAAGGVRVLEITLRTPVALQAVEAIARGVPESIVGVGTITHADDLRRSADAGAGFGVSPGLTPALIAAAHSSPLPLLPGVMTPSDLMTARGEGFTHLKLFPAVQAGGVGMLRALGGPFPDISFCPTGGITEATAPEYLALANVACVGGSWLTPPAAVRAGQWQTITALARTAAGLRR